MALVLGCGGANQHGNITSLSVSKRRDWKACRHGVPEEVCVRCHPDRAAQFKARGDWCPEHDTAESQCLVCHPDLDFSPPRAPPAGADVVQLVKGGADLAELEPHRVPGKVTVFDFYAAWCPPCRKVDEHLYAKLGERSDIALRKLDVESWDSPLAERWLRDVPELPYLVVYDKRGKRVAAISGARLTELDRVLEAAAR